MGFTCPIRGADGTSERRERDSRTLLWRGRSSREDAPWRASSTPSRWQDADDASLAAYSISRLRSIRGRAVVTSSSTAVTPPTTFGMSSASTTVRALSPKAKIRYTGGSKGWVGDVPRFTYSIEKLKATGWSPKLASDAAVELAIRENVECGS